MESNLYTSNFRQALKALALASLALVLVCASAVYIGGVYSSVVNKNAVNEKSDRRFEDFYALPKNTLDIAFVGSSHSYCSFDPENFDPILGVSSFQLGMPLQQPDATYYTVKEIFNYQSPSVIVAEVYWDMLGRAPDMKQALTLFDSLDNPALEREYVNDVFTPGERLKYRLDILNYQKDYFAYKTTELEKNLRELLGASAAQTKNQGDEYYRSKGYVYCDYVMLPEEFGRTNQFNGFNGNGYEINDIQRSYLKKLVDLCRENGTQIVFVTAPVANASLKKMSNYALVNERLSKMADSLGVPYIDYNMPEIRGEMFQDYNFRDDAHLNDSGVKILNAHFMDWLAANASIPAAP